VKRLKWNSPQSAKRFGGLAWRVNAKHREISKASATEHYPAAVQQPSRSSRSHSKTAPQLSVRIAVRTMAQGAVKTKSKPAAPKK
jgi:hypothetical protein